MVVHGDAKEKTKTKQNCEQQNSKKNVFNENQSEGILIYTNLLRVSLNADSKDWSLQIIIVVPKVD